MERLAVPVGPRGRSITKIFFLSPTYISHSEHRINLRHHIEYQHPPHLSHVVCGLHHPMGDKGLPHGRNVDHLPLRICYDWFLTPPTLPATLLRTYLTFLFSPDYFSSPFCIPICAELPPHNFWNLLRFSVKFFPFISPNKCSCYFSFSI